MLGHEFVGEVIGHGPGCTDQFPVGARVTSMPMRLVDGGAGGMRIIGQHPEAQGSFGELLVVAGSGGQAGRRRRLQRRRRADRRVRRRRVLRPLGADWHPVRSPIVIGAGAVGLSAVAALASRGIEPIIVADYKSERRELARDGFGAHIVVDPAEKSPFDAFQRGARRTRNARVRQSIFECVGRRRADPEDRRIRRNGHPDLLRGRLVHRRHPRHHHRDPPGRHHPVRRRSAPAGLVRHARRHRVGTAGPAAQRRQGHHPRRGARRARTRPQVRRARRGSSCTPTETVA